ncbi:MAG: hypothetical protein H0W53_09175 [Acidobacteria bacterium]|nr:hypothetical protein [Acidobacteriota bacterium]
MSRPLTAALLVAGCITAAAGGSYIAARQNAVTPVTEAAPAHPAAGVGETEGVIEAPNPAPAVPAPQLERTPDAVPVRPAPENRRRTVPAPLREKRRPTVRAANSAVPEAPALAVEAGPSVNARPEPQPIAQATESAVGTASYARPEPVLTEVVIPASAVIGLEIETTVSSERARLEDRVEARVTRDVFADGRLALPAGSRVIGAVSLIERGGKVKERARLGVRFHTVVLANGRQSSLRTEPIYREGESPAGSSSKKIGGAAIGGAVLGAILGGGKGAIAGATAGAAGGTAVVMTGDRTPAVLSAGSIVTVKLAEPASLDVER